MRQCALHPSVFYKENCQWEKSHMNKGNTTAFNSTRYQAYLLHTATEVFEKTFLTTITLIKAQEAIIFFGSIEKASVQLKTYFMAKHMLEKATKPISELTYCNKPLLHTDWDSNFVKPIKTWLLQDQNVQSQNPQQKVDSSRKYDKSKSANGQTTKGRKTNTKRAICLKYRSH